MLERRRGVWIRSVATSIHGDVKDLFFRHPLPATTVMPVNAGMTTTSTQLSREVMSSRDQPKTWPERQWLLADSRPHVCAPASNHLSPNRLVFRCFLGDFFCTSKRSYLADEPRPGAVHRAKALIHKGPLSPTRSYTLLVARTSSMLVSPAQTFSMPS